MVREIVGESGATIAIIVHSGYTSEGTSFLTPGNFSQQLGYINRPAGYVIAPHIHRDVFREVQKTQEVLFLKKGKLKANFFDQDRCFLESHILEAGDVVMLVQGGHGFEVLEDVEMFEVKQGPYAGDHDKVVFVPDCAGG